MRTTDNTGGVIWQTDTYQPIYPSRQQVWPAVNPSPGTSTRRSLSDFEDSELIMEMISRGYAVMNLDEVAEKVK